MINVKMEMMRYPNVLIFSLEFAFLISIGRDRPGKISPGQWCHLQGEWLVRSYVTANFNKKKLILLLRKSEQTISWSFKLFCYLVLRVFASVDVLESIQIHRLNCIGIFCAK